MDDFERIISYESLYKAHRRARLSKRHKKEVILFEANLSENLWKLHYDLKYGRYVVGGYHKFMIYDPKEREIQAIGYRDRVVQHALCDGYLTPLLDRRLIYDNAACRKKKGTSFALSRWRQFMTAHYKKYGTGGYFVKLDVKKYFPSISHELLKQKLAQTVGDSRILTLLYQIIDSYQKDLDRGLPMGNQTSQCFALLYLDEVDRYVKEILRVKYYVRYMDDMLFLVPQKERAEKIIAELGRLLRKNRLLINPKSQSIAIKNGINFLGWHFFYGNGGEIVQKVCSDTKKRIRNHVRETYCRRKLNMDKFAQIQASYNGYLGKGDSFFYLRDVRSALECVEMYSQFV